MRSHRLALTTLALLGSVLATGCGSGRDTAAFLPAAEPATASAPPATTAIPQVVVAGPKQALIDERDAAAAEARASRQAAAEADRKRQVARRALRKERTQARRDRRRAARREAELQSALVAAEKRRPRPAAVPAPAATPRPEREPASAPITASDTGSQLVAERNRRSDAEARAAVLRFHELLDGRDVRSCDMLTDRLLTAVYGAEDPRGRCQAAVTQIASTVSVVIAESRTSGKASSVAVITTIGDQEFPQTMHLVLVDGSWLFDAVERGPAA